MSTRRAALFVLAAAGLLAPALRAADPAAPATRPAATQPTTWRALFDGKTLDGWRVADFGGHGDPEVEDGAILLPQGEGLTGVNYTGELPKIDYEVSLEAKRVSGVDFFCGLTVPVGDTFASLIVGGWGGTVVGISSLDGSDAAHNETRTNRRFEKGKWYRIRLRVTADRLRAWIDDEKVVDVVTTGKKIGIRADINASKPFGLSAWQTTAAVRDVKVRAVGAEEKN